MAVMAVKKLPHKRRGGAEREKESGKRNNAQTTRSAATQSSNAPALADRGSRYGGLPRCDGLKDE